MNKVYSFVAAIAAVLAAGCSSCNTNAVATYQAPNNANACNVPVAKASNCNSNAVAKAAPTDCNANAMALQSAPANNCNAMAAPAPVLTAAPEVSACGPLPADALPGQTWCCEAIPQAAPPPTRVCVCPEQTVRTAVPAEYETVTEQFEVAPARTEWQSVVCETGSGECFRLVNIPAQYETRTRQRLIREAYERVEYTPARFENVASAPLAPIYRWVRHEECDPRQSPPVAPAAVVAPASSVPTPAVTAPPIGNK